MVTNSVSTITCDGNRYPQTYQNYASVINEAPGGKINTLYCAVSSTIPGRVLSDIWDAQHTSTWNYWVPQFNKPNGKPDRCNRDEYPPFAFQYPAESQWLRFLSEYDNKGAGNLWRGVCKAKPRSSTTVVGGPVNALTCTNALTITYTVNAMSMNFINNPANNDYGVGINSCLPSTLVDDSGYALMSADLWYDANIHTRFRSGRSNYPVPPVAALTMGKTRPRSSPAKRWLQEPLNGDPDDIIVNDGNSTRKPSDEELWDQFRLMRCRTAKCATEREAFGFVALDDENSESMTTTLSGSTAATATADAGLRPEVNSPSAKSTPKDRIARPTAMYR